MLRTKIKKSSSSTKKCKPHVLLEFFMVHLFKNAKMYVTHAKNDSRQYRCTSLGV